jgi:hypothetical protein
VGKVRRNFARAPAPAAPAGGTSGHGRNGCEQRIRRGQSAQCRRAWVLRVRRNVASTPGCPAGHPPSPVSPHVECTRPNGPQLTRAMPGGRAFARTTVASKRSLGKGLCTADARLQVSNGAASPIPPVT